MSSSPCGAPLEINIRPSRVIAALLLMIHVTAAIVVTQLPVPIFARLIILLAVIGSFMWNVVLYWHRTPKSIRWQPDAGWLISDHRNRTESVELLPQAHLGNWLTVAHFRTMRTGKRRSVMLAGDSCSGDSLRRLRVLLRYGTPKQ